MTKPRCELDGLVAALNQRAIADIAAATTPDISLTITGSSNVPPASNEQLWRAVTLHGHDELQRYLQELYSTLPGLTFEAHETHQDEACLRAEAAAAGVDRQGEPFETSGRVRLCLVDGLVSSAEITVGRVVAGGELLRGGDPERYLRQLLEQRPELQHSRGAA